MPANLENSSMATGLEKVSFHSNPKESESEVSQSCPTPSYPMDCSLPGSSVHGIFQARVLKGNAKECSNYCTIALISHASKVMLKILQARLQQYVNHELPDVQAGFRKGQRNKRSNCQHSLDHRKNKRVPEKHLFLLC